MKKLIINALFFNFVFFSCQPAFAKNYELLDVFEEYATQQSTLVTENMFIETQKNNSVDAVLKFSKDDGEISVELVTLPQNGNVTLTDNSGAFTYTPNDGYTGTDLFQFKISRNDESSNISYCGITVLDTSDETPSTSFIYEDMRTHWANYSAVKLVESDVLKGERIGNRYYFHPETKIRRIDVIEYILAALGADFDKISENNTHIFADSSSLPEYINQSAYLAKEYGFLEGSQEGTLIYLKPYDYISRAEIIRMIDLAMKAKTLSKDKLNFADTAQIPDWAVQSTKNLVGYGIIHGFDDNTLRPHDNITKAQAAEMIYQMMKYKGAYSSVSSRIKNEIYGTIII